MATLTEIRYLACGALLGVVVVSCFTQDQSAQICGALIGLFVIMALFKSEARNPRRRRT